MKPGIHPLYADVSAKCSCGNVFTTRSTAKALTVELCNECHTSTNYEKSNGIVPGSLLYNWQVQQAAFLKHTIGVKQVIGISASPHLLLATHWPASFL